MKTLKSLVFLCVFATCGISCFGQQFQEQPSHYRVTFSAGLTFQNHFDGNQTIEWNDAVSTSPFEPGERWVRFLNAGIIFQTEIKLNVKYSLGGMANGLYTYHPEECHHCGSPGDILARGNALLQLYARRELLDIGVAKLRATVGLTYRYGYETTIINYGAFDVHVLTRTLNDFGLTGGVGAYRDVAKNRMRLSLAINYTQFVYRSDTGLSDYSWDRGSTPRMISFIFGVGYRFGRIGGGKSEFKAPM